MGESSRDEELSVVFFRKFDGDMLAECRRAFADVHSDIQDLAFDDTHELALCVRGFLEMETSEDAVAGFAFVVLYKLDFADVSGKVPF